MRQALSLWLIGLSFMVTVNVCFSLPTSSKAEAEVLVKSARIFYEATPEAALNAFTQQDQRFKYHDLYVVVYDLNGKVLAHGQYANMVGKTLIDLKDPAGNAFVRERVELAKKKKPFWQTYKFTDPITEKVLDKQMYCEPSLMAVVCAGIYDRPPTMR